MDGGIKDASIKPGMGPKDKSKIPKNEGAVLRGGKSRVIKRQRVDSAASALGTTSSPPLQKDESQLTTSKTLQS